MDTRQHRRTTNTCDCSARCCREARAGAAPRRARGGGGDRLLQLGPGRRPGVLPGQAAATPPQPQRCALLWHHCTLELQTEVRQDFTITEKAPTRDQTVWLP